ncbi:LPS export ABC transporter permease LptF [Endozoicomonas sp. OPT23]|uniref:LPS export ABC transporter permease LptF n=1 Tax=Endozoicomonas sp. OPT23 TaxID=2072845 RepID=UPI00129A5F2A|nr:LPS export ABC transporter permease LptF [Endozoicomonas sp. OPT23]MRI34582.1 LPS export ABC transporter permease LptF [Endozoicomonas sp. OPT23]
MPSILFRYLAKEMLQVTLAVTGVVLLIIMSGRFVNYLAQAANGTLNANFLFAIMGYRMPEFLVMIIPLGLLLGIVMAYGRLYVENEMTIMSACGLSQNQLLKMTMVPALGVMLLVGLLSLFVAPQGLQKVEAIWAKQDSLTEFDTLVPGRFQTFSGTNRVTYTETLTDDNQKMEGVFIAQGATDPDGGSISLVLADSGRISNTESEQTKYLILNDGIRYDLSPGGLKVRETEYKTYGIRMQNSKVSQEITREQALPTSQLLSSDTREHKAELQWRFSMPLLIPILVLLAVPLAKVNPRQGRFVKLLPGVLTYLLYLSLLISTRGMIDEGRLPPSIGLWPVHGAFLLLALGVYFKDSVLTLLSRKSMARRKLNA